MLVTLKEILQDAAKKNYAVGAFNLLNLEMARGIVEAAEEERSPAILALAQIHLPYLPFDYAGLIMRDLAARASVPVCLHFDHGTDLGAIALAAQNGFSSVMYDGSALPYEENLRNTREAVRLVEGQNVSVEAELGHVGGGEDGLDDGYAANYTDPAQVRDFIERTGVDALAVAIGTAHGKYLRPPVLSIDLLAEIRAVSSVPLVLHGGSGLSNDDFTRAIQNGISKVNIYTELAVAAQGGYTRGAGFEQSLLDAKDAVKEVARQKMRLFGSSGRV